MPLRFLNFEIRKINNNKKKIIEVNPQEKNLIKNCLKYSMTNF